jgi:glycosyltransferase involved in cell wall biosynthesis
VGATLCLALVERGCEVVALDNLRRRGAELNVGRLRDAGVNFLHGDVRAPADLALPRGFGHAVRAGLERFSGDAVAIVMADGSDNPRELVLYYRVLEAGYECAFGSRFMPGAHVEDYPRFKLVINRAVNLGIRMLFRHRYNDTTNAFKAYRREVIETVQPLLSRHFNLTVELPLKAIVRGHTYAVVPISWRNRRADLSKFDLQEMGSRYLFIILYVFLEAHLSRGDYRRADWEAVHPERHSTLRALAGRAARE